jgi:isopropylmalate/homocitrate/citramalate synthase
MGSVNAYPVKATQSELLLMSVTADLDAANAPTIVEGGNIIQSVTRTGTGEFTVTLRKGFVALRAFAPALQAATAIDLVPQLKSNDVSSAKTVVVRLLAAATPTDPPAVGTNATRLSLLLAIRDTTVKQ